MIDFEANRKVIVNPITERPYHLVALKNLEQTESQVERVASICNEPLVFETLFSDVFPEGKYPLLSATDWIRWGKAGWKDGSHFVFATLDESGLVVATSDIKSANMDSAEIGYWASALHPGIMTNSVAAMLHLAKESGFRRFFAEVHKDNPKSQGVLMRNNFLLSTDTATRPHHMVFRC